MGGHQDMVTSYKYNRIGQLIQKTFPDGLQVSYKHEATSGDVYDVRFGDRNIYHLADDNGTARTVMYDGTYTEEEILPPNIGDFPIKDMKPSYVQVLDFGNCIYATEKRDNHGILSSCYMSYGATTLDSISFTYDAARGNLLSRTRGTGQAEEFTYDDIDRLIEVSANNNIIGEAEYASNGNITWRNGIGQYTYGSAKPHAVTSVENLDGSITGASQATSFNGFGKVTRVIDGNEAYQMDITYGPDQQRWKSVLTKMGQPVRTTIYADDYEEVISADSTTRRFHYLDGGAVVVSQDEEDDAVYYAFTDNLGSVLRLVNNHGETAFEASYDAWGKQTVTTDSIGFRRGYTGHEMLPEFGLVNMNGRMYDPVIGRFISPDDYVQLPDFSQSYNRYSYCLNNPLKYTDPSGEFAFAPVIFGAAMGAMLAKMNGQNPWKGALIGGGSAALSYGIGSIFGHTVSSVGMAFLRAGAHGLAQGTLNGINHSSFGVGFATGFTSSMAGFGASSLKFSPSMTLLTTTATGALTSAALGGSWMNGMSIGLNIGLFNELGGEETFTKLGKNSYLMQEVFVVGHRGACLEMIGAGLTVFSSIGSSLKNNSGNSTIGSNRKFYWHATGERGFYGNQYVKAYKLTNIGTKITRATSPVGKLYDGYSIVNGVCADFQNYQYYGYSNGYNTVHAAADVAGGWAGALAGAKAGFFIGAYFEGFGAIPGAIIGGAAGGIAGSFGGSLIGTSTVDWIYGR
jgi:RHS repeat-associated protein